MGERLLDHPLNRFRRIVVAGRAVVFGGGEGLLSNADRSLPHVESVLRDELAGIAERQSQLVGLLDDLSVMQIDASKVPVTFAGKGTLSARTSFSRLARALHVSPDGLPVLTDSEQTVLELAPSTGGLSVVKPTLG